VPRRRQTELVLQLLRDGHSLNKVAERLKTTAKTIRKWRKNDAAFGNEVERILEARRRGEPPPMAETEGPLELEVAETPMSVEDRLATFLGVYRSTHSRVQAIDAAGFTWTDVEELLDPDHERFDSTFALEMGEEIRRIELDIEDTARQKALDGDNMMIGKLLVSIDPSRYGGQKAKQTPLNINALFMDSTSRDKAEVALETLFGPSSDTRRLREARGGDGENGRGPAPRRGS
jgi:transposase